MIWWKSKYYFILIFSHFMYNVFILSFFMALHNGLKFHFQAISFKFNVFDLNQSWKSIFLVTVLEIFSILLEWWALPITIKLLFSNFGKTSKPFFKDELFLIQKPIKWLVQNHLIHLQNLCLVCLNRELYLHLRIRFRQIHSIWMGII